MSERFSHPRATAFVSAVSALFIGGTAMNRGCNHQDRPPTQAPDLVSEEIRSFLRQILSPVRTPEEEAEICKGHLDDAEAINATEDPEGFLEEVDAYEACAKEISMEAREMLTESRTPVEIKKHHLMRCTPAGESFSLEDMEVCEEAEAKWIYSLSDELEKEGIEVNPSYLSDFEYSETAGAWTNPGYAFELDSQDGSFHGTYQFTIHSEGDGNWGFLMEETPEYYDDPIGDAEYFVHSANPARLGTAFAREYNDMLARDEESQIAREE